MGLKHRFGQTHYVLFITFIVTVMLFLTVAYLLFKFTIDRSLEDYKMIYAKDQTQKIAFSLRTQLEPDRLPGEMADWLEQAVNVYSMNVRYYAPNHETVLYDSWPDVQELERPFTVSSPIYIDGQLIGILESIVDLGDDYNLPTMSFFSFSTLEGGVAILLLCLAIAICYILAMRLSKPLRLSSLQANHIAAGHRETLISETGTAELKQLIASTNRLVGDLNSQEHWREQSMQDLTHELRTPLTSMLSRMEALIDGLYPANEENLNRVYAEIYRLCRLVDDVEKLSEAEGAKFQLDTEFIDIRNLVKDVFENLIFLAKAKDITFNLHTVFIPCPVKVDSDRCVQIITNIISNAIKYTPVGGTIDVGVTIEHKDMITIYCSDNGIGISEQDLPLIFNRFYRADKARSRDTGGIGVGLSIAKALIEAHGGTIQAESELGHGSMFQIDIPEARLPQN
ncbi:ATP-binding protein [Paenibacillus sp. Marseille-Q4541]|uniref:sensor histidine kinase n=1 Tax=Paenibacillus sp. Marseille-Q4541 TaxID=2831522 RepID=UPI001BA585A5|nr:ATP-binding protein [Paenibacillus sp. Marseille-Q4541]